MGQIGNPFRAEQTKMSRTGSTQTGDLSDRGTNGVSAAWEVGLLGHGQWVSAAWEVGLPGQGMVPLNVGGVHPTRGQCVF